MLSCSCSRAGARAASSPALRSTAPLLLVPRTPVRIRSRPTRSEDSVDTKQSFPSDLLSPAEEVSSSPLPSSSVAAGTKQVAYPIVAGLAFTGVVETAYLAAVKLLGAPLVCPASGCENVLSSGYATLFGLPLPFFGLLAYSSIALVAFTALGESGRLQSTTLEDSGGPAIAARLRTFDTALLAGAGLLSGTSATLIYLLNTQLGGEVCFWCYLSALLSASLLGTVLSGMDSSQQRSAALPGLGAFAAAVLVLNLGYGGLNNGANTITEVAYYKPDITSKSSKAAVDMAQRLAAAGAHMYGAFWCDHCYEQKMAFGGEAMATFPYVECFPDGWKRGVEMAPACDAAGVKAFPSWVINGKLIEGELTIEGLEQELNKGSGTSAAEQ